MTGKTPMQAALLRVDVAAQTRGKLINLAADMPALPIPTLSAEQSNGPKITTFDREVLTPRIQCRD
jgi:hypothetical protein